jgi:hypothetical protein
MATNTSCLAFQEEEHRNPKWVEGLKLLQDLDLSLHHIIAKNISKYKRVIFKRKKNSRLKTKRMNRPNKNAKDLDSRPH